MTTTTASTPPRPIITSNDRLGVTVFLAAALHALIILGMTFQFLDSDPPEYGKSLDITIVQTKTELAPEKADYFAQENQQGGGSTTERVKESSPLSVPSQTENQGSAANTKAASSPNDPGAQTAQVLTTQKQATEQTNREVEDPKTKKQDQPSAAQLIQRSLEIARLTAQAENTWKAYSSRPDPKYLTASTKKHQDAAYLASWTQKVERIGNLNYPEQARRKRVAGNLILEVSIRPDGDLLSVKLLESSGHKLLDDAAIRIVRLAAPYAKIPKEVLNNRTELRIVRTWIFTAENRLHSR